MKERFKQANLPLPEFQNVWETKGIFSDHYIRAKLKESPLWPKEEEIKPLWEFCANLWNKLYVGLARQGEAVTRQDFLDKVLTKLGFAYLPNTRLPIGERAQEPDYILFADESVKGQVFEKDKHTQYSVAIALLEAKKVNHPLDTVSRRETPGRFPHQQVRDYLQAATDPFGKPYFRWAILTNGNRWRLYYREAHPDDYFEFNLELGIRSLKDFTVFATLFRPNAFVQDSEGHCPLDDLRAEALHYQTQLEGDLRKRVFNILVELANGFYQRPENKITRNDLDKLYQHCLIFLYRLLFSLYAEGRGLLPVKPYGAGSNKNYRERYSLQRLLPQLRDSLHFTSDEFTELYEQLLGLFHLINGDQPSRNKACDVPLYNGGLFDSKKYRLLEYWRAGERTLAEVLRGLMFSNIPVGTAEQRLLDFGETIDYADLEVRQLGSIYEGLLENHLEPEGDRLILRGDRSERKATGTYYTPDYIVQYIVKNTLEPLCREVDKSQEVQQAVKKGIKNNSFAKSVLKFNILDPAMGSGHFLVRATEFLAEQIFNHPTTSLQVKRVPRGLSHEQAEISYWRRRVVESCIYGVDVNPLAVELAKLSLWLTCIATDQPLSFLDHHLRTGNSLIGAKLADLDGLPQEKDPKQLSLSFGPDLPKAVSEAIRALKEIEETESADVSTIKDKESRWHKEVWERLKPYRTVADLWTSTFFENQIDEATYHRLAELLVLNPKASTKKTKELKKELKPFLTSLESARKKMFFHWELEFPEVFFDGDGAPKENPGFDAVIGNPPWGGRLSEIQKQYFRQIYESGKGALDTFALFTEEKIRLASYSKMVGVVLPDIILLKDYPQIRKFILGNCYITNAVHWGRAFPEAKIDACTLVLRKQRDVDNESRVNVIRDIVNWEKCDYTKSSIPQRAFKENAEYKFNLYLTELILRLISLLDYPSVKLATITHAHEGIHSGNIRNKLFPYHCLDDSCFPLLLGGDELRRYELLLGGRFVHYDEKIILREKGEYANLAKRGCFIDPKLLIQRTGDRVIASYDNTGLYASNNFFTCQLKSGYKHYNLKYLLAVLNSPIATWYFRSIQPRVGRLYAELKIVHLNELPIRRISFTTPKEERKKLSNKFKKMYETSKIDALLKFIDQRLQKIHKPDLELVKNHNADPSNKGWQIREGASWEQSDVVHDILAFLAEKMIEYNKEKNEEVKSFLGWLERETGGKVEDLSGKTITKNYHQYEIDKIIEVLKKNGKHLQIDPSRRNFQDKLTTEFNRSLKKVNPLNQKIQVTDTLIDQIIYKLYGLTGEEIRIIEGEIEKSGKR